MKSNAKSVDNRVDIDVFDPENDAQMHEPQPKVAKPSGKVGGSKEEETGSKSLSEREKELSKLKVCAYRGCVPPGQTWPSCGLAWGCGRADTRVGNAQVVQLKEKLQKRKLPYAGKKDELVNRLAVAMELEASQTQAKTMVEMWVGKGARVGRWHGLAEELALAFAMGTHARLGAGAGVTGGRWRSRRVQDKAPAGGEDDGGCPYFMMPGDLVKRVVEACRWGAGGEAEGFGEGVLRLMGAGRTRRWT